MIHSRLAALLFVLLLFAGGATARAANPFVTPKTTQTTDRTPAIRGPAFLQPALARVVLWQLHLRQRMGAFAQDIQVRPLGRSFWLFMLLAFTYGVVHALGPGHGKLLAASYFLNRPGSLLRGLLFGNLTMVFHVLSATALVLIGYGLLRISASSAVDTYGRRLETVSYVLLLLLGLVLTVRSLLEARRGSRDKVSTTEQPETRMERRYLLGATMAAGMVPCPGAAMVLIFALGQGILPAGLSAMLCISLGMGLTISAVAMAAILSRGLMLRLTKRHRRVHAVLHTGLSLAGALLVTCFGGMLLLGELAG